MAPILPPSSRADINTGSFDMSRARAVAAATFASGARKVGARIVRQRAAWRAATRRRARCTMMTARAVRGSPARPGTAPRVRRCWSGSRRCGHRRRRAATMPADAPPRRGGRPGRAAQPSAPGCRGRTPPRARTCVDGVARRQIRRLLARDDLWVRHAPCDPCGPRHPQPSPGAACRGPCRRDRAPASTACAAPPRTPSPPAYADLGAWMRWWGRAPRARPRRRAPRRGPGGPAERATRGAASRRARVQIRIAGMG